MKAAIIAERGALVNASLFADDPTEARNFLGHAFVEFRDIVERIRDLAGDARPFDGQPIGIIALAQRHQRGQEDGGIDTSVGGFQQRCHR